MTGEKNEALQFQIKIDGIWKLIVMRKEYEIKKYDVMRTCGFVS